MAFLDKKEQVIDLQLTQYGKKLLSKGKLTPVYYAFYDNDVIYDSNYASLNEHQNDTDTRISSNTPQIDALYVCYGLETQLLKDNKIILSEKKTLDYSKTKEKIFNTIKSLGNSEEGCIKYPSFEIAFLDGDISESTPVLSSSYQIEMIPQISSSITYRTKISKIEDYIEDKTIQEETQPEDFINEKVFGDGSYINVEDGSLIIQLSEHNSLFQNENYDIELFSIEDTEDNSKESVYSPMFFKIGDDDTQINKNFVNYFFDILVDDEISEEEICRLQSSKDRIGIYDDSNSEGCGEKKCLEKKNTLYGNIIIDDIEECK